VVPDRGLTKSNEIRRGVEGRKADLAVVVVHVPVARWRGRYQTMWQRTVLCGVMVGARMVVGWREMAWWARVLLEFEETLAHQTMPTARLAGGGVEVALDWMLKAQKPLYLNLTVRKSLGVGRQSNTQCYIDNPRRETFVVFC
jgi:hypothetical protein